MPLPLCYTQLHILELLHSAPVVPWLHGFGNSWYSQ